MAEKTDKTNIIAVDISKDMIDLAKSNAKAYQLQSRIKFVLNDGKDIKFKADTFDAVFSSGSLHEWAEPVDIFNHLFVLGILIRMH